MCKGVCRHYRYIFQPCHYILRYVFGVGVSCRNLYSFVVYLYVNGSGSITSVGEERELICLLLFTCNYVVSVGEVSSSSGCLRWATLFYCGTPWAFI